jgi:hypothetical protein
MSKKDEKPSPKSPESNVQPAPEPSLTISLEEISLLLEGVEKLPIERTKTVVFDRLMMKLGKVENYWKRVEKAREVRKAQIADDLLKKKDG